MDRGLMARSSGSFIRPCGYRHAAHGNPPNGWCHPPDMGTGLYPDEDHWNMVQFVDTVLCADRDLGGPVIRQSQDGAIQRDFGGYFHDDPMFGPMNDDANFAHRCLLLCCDVRKHTLAHPMPAGGGSTPSLLSGNQQPGSGILK